MERLEKRERERDIYILIYIYLYIYTYIYIYRCFQIISGLAHAKRYENTEGLRGLALLVTSIQNPVHMEVPGPDEEPMDLRHSMSYSSSRMHLTFVW